MHNKRMSSPIIPTLRYNDAKAAVNWLRDAFGFDELVVYEDDDSMVLNAQLGFGDAMIMLSNTRETEFDELQGTPEDAGGLCTQSCYIVVDDIEQHYAQACEAGAEVVIELKHEDYGGAGYTCRDPEGHLWNFGTYDPWASSDDETTEADED